MSKCKTMVLGLDGAPPSVMNAWMDAGELPNFAALRERGTSGTLSSSVNCMTPSAWTSMVTGFGPAYHTLLNFVEYEPGSHGVRVAHSSRRAVPTLWEHASEAGIKCCALRVPITHPATPINGWMVAGHLTPSVDQPGFTYPPELTAKLVSRFGRHGWGRKWADDTPTATGKYGRAARQILAGIDRSFDLIDMALHEVDPDLIFAVVFETDEVAHNFWHLMDETSAYHDPAAAARYGGVILEAYQRIDARLGRLSAELPSDATILVVSDHGMGPARPGGTHVRSLLVAAGYQAMRPEDPGPPSLRARAGAIKARVAGMIPWEVRRRFKPLSVDAWSRGAHADLVGSVDWEQTRAFTIISGLTGEVWLNLRGRSPAGVVEPGPEAESLLQSVRALFESAVEPQSGRPVVLSMASGKESCPGPAEDRMPDLFIQFADDIHCDALAATHPETGQRLIVDDTSPGAIPLHHYSFHQREGVLIAAGGRVAAATEPVQAKVEDIAATVLWLVGLPIPGNAEGRVIRGLFSRETLENDEPVVGPPVEVTTGDGAQLSAEEVALVEGRLRDLGYL